jgi:uncharacterized integral membrane protein
MPELLQSLPNWLQLLAWIGISAIVLAGSAKGLLQTMVAYDRTWQHKHASPS